MVSIDDGLCPQIGKRMTYQGEKYCTVHDDVIGIDQCLYRSREKFDVVSESLVKDLSLSKCTYLGKMK